MEPLTGFGGGDHPVFDGYIAQTERCYCLRILLRKIYGTSSGLRRPNLGGNTFHSFLLFHNCLCSILRKEPRSDLPIGLELEASFN